MTLLGLRCFVVALGISFVGSITSPLSRISSEFGQFYETLQPGDLFGSSIAEIGDIDGDGIPDIAVGAPENDDGGQATGAVYIIFINHNGACAASEKISVGHGRFNTSLPANSRLGFSVGFAGDMNNDGVPDVIAGVGSHEGVFLLFLEKTGLLRSHTFISATSVGSSVSEGFGAAVSSIGDIDGDGQRDIAIGAPRADQGRGSVILLFMNRGGTTVSRTQRIAQSTGRLDRILTSSAQFGSSLTTGQDVDSDGVVDFVTTVVEPAPAILIVFLHSDGTVKRTLQHQIDILGTSALYALMFYDFDNNGERDLLVASPDSASFVILLMNDVGNIVNQTSFELQFPTTRVPSTTFGVPMALVGDFRDGAPIFAISSSIASGAEILILEALSTAEPTCFENFCNRNVSAFSHIARSAGHRSSVLLTMNLGPNETTTNSPSVRIHITFEAEVVRFVASDVVVTFGTRNDSSVVVTNFEGVNETDCYLQDPEDSHRYWAVERCARVFVLDLDLSSASGVIMFNVKQNVAFDLSGNGNLAAVPLFVVTERTPPTASLIVVDSGNTNSNVISGIGHEYVAVIHASTNLNTLIVLSFLVGSSPRLPNIVRSEGDHSHRTAKADGRIFTDFVADTWILSYVVQPGDDGLISFELELTDTYGNVGSVLSTLDVVDNQVVADTLPPQARVTRFSSGQITTSVAGPGDTMVIEIQVPNDDPTELLQLVDPFTFLVGGILRPALARPITPSPSQFWSVTYQVQSDDNGPVEFVITCYDVAGNSVTLKSQADSTVTVYSRKALYVRFRDTNPHKQLISGRLAWERAVPEVDVIGYAVHLGANATKAVGGELGFLDVSVQLFELQLVNVNISSATHILIFALINRDVLPPNPQALDFKGGLVGPESFPTNLRFVDTHEEAGMLTGEFIWDAANPESNVKHYNIHLTKTAEANSAPTLLESVPVGRTHFAIAGLTTKLSFAHVVSVDEFGNFNPTVASLHINDLIGPRGTIPRISFKRRASNTTHISGLVEWNPFIPTGSVVKYHIYIGDSATSKSSGRLATVLHRASTALYSHYIEVPREEFSRFVLVYPSSASREAAIPAFSSLNDNVNMRIPNTGKVTIDGARVSFTEQTVSRTNFNK